MALWVVCQKHCSSQTPSFWLSDIYFIFFLSALGGGGKGKSGATGRGWGFIENQGGGGSLKKEGGGGREGPRRGSAGNFFFFGGGGVKKNKRNKIKIYLCIYIYIFFSFYLFIFPGAKMSIKRRKCNFRGLLGAWVCVCDLVRKLPFVLFSIVFPLRNFKS